MTLTNIKLASWNAKGLSNHIQELKTFVFNNNLDIVLISETHLTDKNYIKVPGYTIYSTQHPQGKARGGTAVIIKNEIKHHEIAKYSENKIQATSIIVEEWNGHLVISAIYCPPGSRIKKEDFDTFFNSLGHKFIAAGDYNAKHKHWGSRLITTRGRQLLASMRDNNLQHLSTGEPTYWPSDRHKIPDLLDFCVIKGIATNYLTIETSLDLSSDHSPIIVTLNTNFRKYSKSPTLFNKLTNWDTFRNNITIKLDITSIKLKSESDIDEAVENLTTVIQYAARTATPKTKMKTVEDSPYCPRYIKEKIISKRKLRKRWQTTRAPGDKANLNRAIKEIKELLQEMRNRGIKDYLESLTATESTEYSLWKATKRIKRPQVIIPPIRKDDGNWARNDEEKAERFASHLSKVFQPFHAEVSPEEEEKITHFLNAPYQLNLPIKPFKASELQETIRHHVNLRKAPGNDLITGKILKELPQEGIKMITLIFNAILRIGYFPLQWKVAQIIVVPKPGKDPTEVTSYRPISLLSVVSKVFEKLFLKRMKPIIEENNLIPTYQFGFRHKHSTAQQVHRLARKINSDLQHNRYCSAVFIDISQAFDKAWHDGIIYKIKKNLPSTYCKVIQSYLTNRRYLVKFKEAYTTPQLIQSGVPQGSVLGPVLYLLLTADMPTTNNTTLATYADDTAIMASHQNQLLASRFLQKHLEKLEIWLKTWRIKTNSSKSAHITFTLRKGTCPTVTLNNVVIPQKEDIKYLGIHLDRRLTWAKHIWYKRLQLGHIYRKMYWLMGRKSQLKLENKLLLYKSVIKPVWTYGIQIWGTASDTNIAKLQRFQSKVLRSIVDAPWYVPNQVIQRDLNMPSVMDEIQIISTRYLASLEEHPNPLVEELVIVQETKRLKRRDQLDLPERQSK